jgi:uncharacterized Zn-binding protein involved in type VI secretion
MPDAARKGDQTSHGGTITEGEETVSIAGKPAARVGDDHSCPASEPGPKPHKGGPIQSPGSITVSIAGKAAARVGDQATCAGATDTISAGEPTVQIGD